jgi:hypothetical protein
MDGYTLGSRSGLPLDKLAAALRELRAQDLVIIKGDFSADKVGEAYIYVPPDALGYADMVLGRAR